MIVLIIYFIGIFITPIILKKVSSKCEDFAFVVSVLWPIAVIILIFFKFADLIEYIYKKA